MSKVRKHLVNILSLIITIVLFVLQVISQNYSERNLFHVISVERFASKNDVVGLIGLFDEQKVITTDGSHYRQAYQAYLQLKNGKFSDSEVGLIRNYEDYKSIVEADKSILDNANQLSIRTDMLIRLLNLLQYLLFLTLTLLQIHVLKTGFSVRRRK